MQGFYAKKAAALVQKQEPAGPPPPPGFEAYKKNAAAGGVMGMIQQIINESGEISKTLLTHDNECRFMSHDRMYGEGSSLVELAEAFSQIRDTFRYL